VQRRHGFAGLRTLAQICDASESYITGTVVAGSDGDPTGATSVAHTATEGQPQGSARRTCQTQGPADLDMAVGNESADALHGASGCRSSHGPRSPDRLHDDGAHRVASFSRVWCWSTRPHMPRVGRPCGVNPPLGAYCLSQPMCEWVPDAGLAKPLARPARVVTCRLMSCWLRRAVRQRQARGC
jgi:hypothetical protein